MEGSYFCDVSNFKNSVTGGVNKMWTLNKYLNIYISF